MKTLRVNTSRKIFLCYISTSLAPNSAGCERNKRWRRVAPTPRRNFCLRWGSHHATGSTGSPRVTSFSSNSLFKLRLCTTLEQSPIDTDEKNNSKMGKSKFLHREVSHVNVSHYKSVHTNISSQNGKQTFLTQKQDAHRKLLQETAEVDIGRFILQHSCAVTRGLSVLWNDKSFDISYPVKFLQ